MTKTIRIIDSVLCAALLLAWTHTTCVASERETPLVRAVKRARACVANIHSEKTTYSGETLFSPIKGRKINGMGTGIIVDERGYIVTNSHVVSGVDSLRVTLDDGSTYHARMISYDTNGDLAIIKINPTKPLSIMPTGTSSDLMLGETVIAVGNAFGYEHTVTSGIVSSLSRDVEVNEKQSYKNLIQTDASINPGNSGGPLLNLEGEVVGINVAIRAGAQRIGFAIPIDKARKVIAKLLSIEYLDRISHGLLATDVKSGKKRMMVVDSMEPNSPATEAGFQSGDIVVKAGTIDVVDGADFERALLGRSANEVVEVVVRRDNRNETLSLKLLKQRHSAIASVTPKTVIRPQNESVFEKTWRTLGIKLSKLTNPKAVLSGSRYRGGMRVVEVRPGSPAETNGIQQKDILVGLHIWETVSVENVCYVLDHPQFSKFGPLKFYILRGHNTLFGHMRLAQRRGREQADFPQQ